MIFSVEKRKKRVKGVLKSARLYSLRYRIGDMPAPKWQALGVTDKTVAIEEARKFIRDLEHEMAGIALPKKEVQGATMLITDLVTEYAAELSARGRDAKYVSGTAKRIRGVAKECGWKKLKDASADSFMAWRRVQEKKAKTLNDYLSDVRSFFQCQIDLERLRFNPLAKVPRKSEVKEEAEVRRAFSTEEFDRLCAVSGPRTILYQVTTFCGLRRKEVGKLLWGDVLTDREGEVFLKLPASLTKNGKVAMQPVPPWLAELLNNYRPAAAKLSDRVFPQVPRMPRFLKDLDAAKITRVDERGHVSKFHSLRHTLGTWLWATGADPRSIMKLMRHSDLNLTTRRYTDEAGLASNVAVQKLPRFDKVMGTVTQIVTQISDFSGQILSLPVAMQSKNQKMQVAEKEQIGRCQSRSVACGQMVRAAGFEPATPSV